MATRAAQAAAIGAFAVGGAALGFLAERSLVRRRLVPTLPPADLPLGSFGGEITHVDGPDGTRIVVESYGPRGAPQLVLAHGWICTGRVWHEVVTRLCDRVRIITYDQPGHGRSSTPDSDRYEMDLLGDTLRTVVDQATDPGPVVVAGHSMGGMAVLNAIRRDAALRRRVAGVALVSTTSSAKSERLTLEVGIRAIARLERGIRRVVPALRHPRVVDVTDRITNATSDLSYLAARWTSVGPQADPRVVAFTQELALSSGSAVVLGYAEAVLGVDEDVGLDALSGIPTVIVAGTADRLTPSVLGQRMAERAGAVLVELEGIGHMSLLEAGEALSQQLVALLEGRIDPAGHRRPAQEPTVGRAS